MESAGLKIVDTHCHLWNLEVSGKTWVTSELGELHRSYVPDDLEEAGAGTGVTTFVVVEAGATPQENRELERMAESSDLIGAIIPYADLESRSLEAELEHWAQVPKYRGLRMRFEGHPDPGIVARPGVARGLAMLAETGHVFDYLARASHLEDILRLHDKTPDLKGVIEHMAKPDMAERSDRAEWHSGMRLLARNTGLACKISLSPRGEEMDRLYKKPGQGWSSEAIKPFVQHLLDEFGPERLMWGSDWPIALLTSDYSGTYEAMRGAIGPLRAEDEERMFRTNALRFYGLQER